MSLKIVVILLYCIENYNIQVNSIIHIQKNLYLNIIISSNILIGKVNQLLIAYIIIYTAVNFVRLYITQVKLEKNV